MKNQLVIISGPMFAGKTTKLIELASKAEQKGQKVIIFKYLLDTRYSNNNIVTHDNVMHSAIPCQSLTPYLKDCEKADFIGIDEGQFFPDLKDFVNKAIDYKGVNNNKMQIVISSLDGDFKRNPFGETLDLIPICTKFYKLNSTSKETNEIAPFSMRIVASSKQMLIGGSESYKPVSRSVYKGIQTKGFVHLILSSHKLNELSTMLFNEINLISGSDANSKVLLINYKEENDFDNSISVKNLNQIPTLEEIKEFDVIAINNFHLFKNGASLCDKLANGGKKVIVSARVANDDQVIFPEVSKMIPMSDAVRFLDNEETEVIDETMKSVVAKEETKEIVSLFI